MENQAYFTNIPPRKEDQGVSEGLERSWWELVGERLSLGMFFYSKQDNQVYINPILRRWLDIKSAYLEDENSIWETISLMAVDPAEVMRELKSIRGNHHLQIPLRNGKEVLSILIFSISGPKPLEGDFGGLVSKDFESNQPIIDLVKVFDSLLVPSRRLSAAVQGNLQALSGHLQAWSPDVLDQFLDITREDLSRLRRFLDLGLSYSKIINQTQLFNQSVSLIGLIERIIEEEGFTSLKVHKFQPEGGDTLLAKIDQAVVKVALQTLLREVADQSPSGQLSELRLSERDGYVILNLDSPRMLPLPGLAAENGEERSELSPELFLAKEILIAQGGNLVFEPRLVDEGGGLEIELSLPAAEPSRSQPIYQEWRDLFEKGSGRILLAETQPEYQHHIRSALTDLGYRVDLAVDGNTVLDLIQIRQPNLVILDRNLPEMDGLLITQGVRRWSAVPIVMISERDSVEDILNAYRAGVDDYLKKPFLIEELLAKVKVFLSRQEAALQPIAPEVFQQGSIRIDYRIRQVWVRGYPVQLTPIEYNLLAYLSRQGRQIIPYEQLLEHVWEGPEKGTRQGLFVHVRRLRAKIEQDPKDPLILSNKWGVGYEFNP